MAHIEKRAQRRYRVRYRDPTGRERSKCLRFRRRPGPASPVWKWRCA
jgi:hypothetical protein